jgi:hypothetical protein
MPLSPVVEKITTIEQMIDWVKRELGAPVIQVEVADEQFLQNLYNTWKYISKYLTGVGNYSDFYAFNIVAGQVRYNLPDDILYVQKLLPDSMIGGVGISADEYLWSNANYIVQTGISGISNNPTIYDKFNMVGYQIGMEFLRMLEFQFDNFYTWRYDGLRKELLVSPTPKSNSCGVVKVYKRQTLEKMFNEPLFMKMFKGYGLISWGNHLSKYSASLVGGGQIDGQSYITRGETMVKEVEDRIDQETEDLGYLTFG